MWVLAHSFMDSLEDQEEVAVDAQEFSRPTLGLGAVSLLEGARGRYGYWRLISGLPGKLSG